MLVFYEELNHLFWFICYDLKIIDKTKGNILLEHLIEQHTLGSRDHSSSVTLEGFYILKGSFLSFVNSQCLIWGIQEGHGE